MSDVDPHWRREVYDDLSRRLTEALDGHLQAFPELDRELLTIGFINAMAIRCGETARRLCPEMSQRAPVVAAAAQALAVSAGLRVMSGQMPVRRDRPNAN
jgi:hypothetical protein